MVFFVIFRASSNPSFAPWTAWRPVAPSWAAAGEAPPWAADAEGPGGALDDEELEAVPGGAGGLVAALEGPTAPAPDEPDGAPCNANCGGYEVWQVADMVEPCHPSHELHAGTHPREERAIAQGLPHRLHVPRSAVLRGEAAFRLATHSRLVAQREELVLPRQALLHGLPCLLEALEDGAAGEGTPQDVVQDAQLELLHVEAALGPSHDVGVVSTMRHVGQDIACEAHDGTTFKPRIASQLPRATPPELEQWVPLRNTIRTLLALFRDKAKKKP